MYDTNSRAHFKPKTETTTDSDQNQSQNQNHIVRYRARARMLCYGKPKNMNQQINRNLNEWKMVYIAFIHGVN